MDLNGGNLKAVANTGFEASAPSWSPFLTAPALVMETTATTVDPGEQTTLMWTSEHADMAVFDDGTGPVSVNTSGNFDVYPTETTTYTLQVDGFGGKVTKSITIHVEPSSI